MRFNPRARLDTSQVEGRGGGGAGGGSMIPGGRIGGGVGGLIIVILVAIFAPQLLNGSDSGGGQAAGPGEDFSQCTTGQSANDSRPCRLVAITNSVQDFWKTELPKETGKPYTTIKSVAFSQSVTTNGCGTATSAAGPFYCPNDQRVYLDLSFFDTLLNQLGGKDTAFTEAYVVAHEYGHHIQNLIGIMGKVRTQQGPNSDSVKLETMADCLAGAWAKHAKETPGPDGQTLITDLTQRDITEGIAAAKVVGDDAIQKKTSGRVNPEGWTHGSSAQREAAFNVGLRDGTIKACNFFDPANRNYPAS
jgi:predicted metalloprotease